MTTAARMPVPEDWASTDASHVISEDGYRIASRVIFPLGGDLDVLRLYVDRTKRDTAQLHPEDILGRHSALVQAGERLSFGSYFNAFAASYWRRWTVVSSVRLVVNTSGDGSLIIYRSNARGNMQRVDMERVSGEHSQYVFDLPLNTFGDGGFYWFDLVASTGDLTLDSAQWWVPAEDRPHGRVTLSTTTYNKPDYVVGNLELIGSETDLLGVLDQILIVDQGTQKVADQPGFEAAAQSLNGRVEIIDQPNLGGSGGFARGQYEVTKRGRSDYVILLDDDIRLEPESIIRLVTFADMCKKPTLAGGHMFDLLNRSVLHTYGEILDPYSWQPSVPGDDQYLGHDFAERGLRETKWLHSRVDVDYNGWWMCLIPVEVIKQIGLSLPIFIKWDDAEYGLRAREHGFNTVSLPGAAVWHVSWLDKDDLVGWQAYFHERNRLMTALMHSRFPLGGGVLQGSQVQDLKHLVSMQYYTMAGRLLGQEDLLNGPDSLHEILASRNAEVRGIAKQYSDAVLKPEYDSYPPIKMKRPKKPTHRRATNVAGDPLEAVRAASQLSAVSKGVKAVLRQFLPTRDGAQDNPQAQIAHKDNKWWNVAQWDSALVTNAEGTGISWYKRQPKLTHRMMAESAAHHAKLAAEWHSLAQVYREALPQLTSFEAWERTFGIDDQAREQADTAVPADRK